jgi:hypothetical protein
MRQASTQRVRTGRQAINETNSDSGWHLLVEDTFKRGDLSADQPAGQVEALLGKALATLSLPAVLLQTISTRLVQALAHCNQSNSHASLSIRVYIQKIDNRDYQPGGNGWGYFLVERRVNNPNDQTEKPEYLFEIYLYTEGERRWA